MEYEEDSTGLTYRYTYGLQKNNVVIYNIPNSVGAVAQTFNYPNGAERVVKLFYHHDRLGSTDILTNNVNGDVTSIITYDQWGHPLMKSIIRLGVRELNLVTEYTGHMWDPVLEAYYARARMYDAADRRFMAVDPVKGWVTNPQSMVQYNYCINNPVKYVDPTGRVNAELSEAGIVNPLRQATPPTSATSTTPELPSVPAQVPPLVHDSIGSAYYTASASVAEGHAQDVSREARGYNEPIGCIVRSTPNVRSVLRDISNFVDYYVFQIPETAINTLADWVFTPIPFNEYRVARLHEGSYIWIDNHNDPFSAPELRYVQSDPNWLEALLWGVPLTAYIEAVVGRDIRGNTLSPAQRVDRLNDGLDLSLHAMTTGYMIAPVVNLNVPTVTYNNQPSNVYRGGNDFTARPVDVKIDSQSGLLDTGYGVSVNVDPRRVPGQAYRIDSIPDGVRIIQRGNKPFHFEIAPAWPMTHEQFQNLLNQVVASVID